MPVPRPDATDAEPRPARKREVTGKLNLNTATEAQLVMLPSIGPAKAERIVTWRKRNGGFKRVVWMSSVLKQTMADELKAVCEREGDPGALADFLTVASRLLYIKSRALLPIPRGEEDDEDRHRRPVAATDHAYNDDGNERARLRHGRL